MRLAFVLNGQKYAVVRILSLRYRLDVTLHYGNRAHAWLSMDRAKSGAKQSQFFLEDETSPLSPSDALITV